MFWLVNVCNEFIKLMDPNQSIYGFRYARPEYFMNYDKTFPGSKLMYLEQNYRSTQTIVNASNTVVKNNVSRIDNKVFTTNKQGDKIYIKELDNNNEEGLYIASEIKFLVDSGKCNYEDIAVLYRTNAQSRAIESGLLALQIQYKLVKATPFFGRREIKDIMAFLRLKANPNDETAFKRIIHQYKGGGDKTIADLIVVANSNSLNLIDILRVVTAPKKIIPSLRHIYNILTYPCDNIYNYMKYVVDETQIIENLTREGTEDALGRIDNINELLAIGKQNENQDLTDFVDQVALSTKEEGSKDKNAVTLMTCHNSKG